VKRTIEYKQDNTERPRQAEVKPFVTQALPPAEVMERDCPFLLQKYSCSKVDKSGQG
jgi:hypothetical protein